jgi:hypothetical protein
MISYSSGDGHTESTYLKVPIRWEEASRNWIGRIITPDSQTVFEVEAPNREGIISKFCQLLGVVLSIDDELTEEVHGMFMPLFYFEE